MSEPKPTITFGYPLKDYFFSGKYQGILRGFYKAFRNKKPIFAPIYYDKKGNSLIDMTQARGEKDI